MSELKQQLHYYAWETRLEYFIEVPEATSLNDLQVWFDLGYKIKFDNGFGRIVIAEIIIPKKEKVLTNE